MLSKVTLIGIHQYSHGSMWDLLQLPDGIDRDQFINEVLRQGGEFPVLYPDLPFLTEQIGAFSNKWYHNFERWIKAYQFEYEALFNLDVKATYTKDGTTSDKGSESGTSSDKRGLSQTVTIDKASYDNPLMVPTDASTSVTSDNTLGERQSESTNNGTYSETSTEVRQGNQGVTMSQEMLLAEYNAWLFNIYDHMAEIFVTEFCVCIYT